MARPTDLNAALIEDMLRHGLTAVFNVTMSGEHPHCGRKEGLLKHCGFSYDPEVLMANNIKHFNFSWPDMTIPTLHQALHIAQIAISEIAAGGKVAVHCHAGFGRTGIAVACILIAKDGLTASEAIACLRSKRPGSVQTTAQADFIHHFERYYAQLLNVFNTPNLYNELNLSISAKTISESVRDQEYTLLAPEKELLRYVHKAVNFLQIILINSYASAADAVFYGICGIRFEDAIYQRFVEVQMDDAIESLIYSLKVQANKNDWLIWIQMLERSLLPTNRSIEHLPSSSSKSDFGPKVQPEDVLSSTPLSQNEVASAAQLLLQWFEDKSEPLFKDRTLSLIARLLKTLAACRYLGIEEENLVWVAIRDLREVPGTPVADGILRQLEDALILSLNKYELHALSRICRIIGAGYTSLINLGHQHRVDPSVANTVCDYPSLRLALVFTLMHVKSPIILSK